MGLPGEPIGSCTHQGVRSMEVVCFGLIVNDAWAVCVSVPSDPVMVRVAGTVVGLVLLVVAIVNVEVPEPPPIDVELKRSVAPTGTPPTLRLTVPL